KNLKQCPFNSPPALADAMRKLSTGISVILHAREVTNLQQIGPGLARITRNILNNSGVGRIVIAGGDTSGHIARALDIDSLEMIAPLTRGAPLCRATAPG